MNVLHVLSGVPVWSFDLDVTILIGHLNNHTVSLS